MTLCFRVFLLICLLTSTARAEMHTQARLLLSHAAAKAGETVTAAVQLKMAEKWHTYWRNAGESGGPTEIKWELPEGISAGEIQWPVPRKYMFEDLATYVFDDEAVLLVPLKISSKAQPGLQKIKATVSWLECADLCVPGSQEVTADLQVGGESKKSEAAAEIESAKTKLPKDGSQLGAKAFWNKPVKKMDDGQESRLVTIEWPSKAGEDVDFFSYETHGYDLLPKTEALTSADGKVRLEKTINKTDADWPKEISGLIVENVSAGQGAAAYEVVLPITTGATTSGPAGEKTKLAQPTESLWKMLLYAFLGGLILNIMPCVLPVIALKVFSFVHQSKQAPERAFKLGLVYAIGVLFSFFVLAGIVVAAKNAGDVASWGIHMQNPYFRLGMTVLMILVALNLFGVFEVTLGSRTMTAASGLASREGPAGAFFNGMLAVALASSCTAPFLVSAVGYAIPQSAGVIFLFFLTIGAGLAFPYVLLSWRPQWVKFIPKPGAWMEKFKIALGFPVLATALWLFSVTTPSFNEDATWGLAVFLLSLSVSIWIWGEFVQRGSKRKALGVVFALAFLAFGYFYGLEDQADWRSPAKNKSRTGAISSKGIDWYPWSAEAVAKARAEGHPVFVDFTAAWCPNCKQNIRRAINIEPVKQKIKETGTVMLIGDFTDRDPSIAAELQKFGQSGVPLNVVFPRNTNEPPIVLPNWLTPESVLEALDKASK